MTIDEYLSFVGKKIKEAADKGDRQECVRLCPLSSRKSAGICASGAKRIRKARSIAPTAE
jgi:hypothetical protein